MTTRPPPSVSPLLPSSPKGHLGWWTICPTTSVVDTSGQRGVNTVDPFVYNTRQQRGRQKNVKVLPSTVKPYKLTPAFDENTVPAGLLKSHSTKEGVWAKVIVTEGELTLRILEPVVEEVIVTSKCSGVVEPTITHEVVPSQQVRFQVEFYR